MIEYPKIETLYERDEKTFKVRPAPSLEQEAEHIAEEFLAHALNRQYLTHRIPVGYLVHLMMAFATRQREGASPGEFDSLSYIEEKCQQYWNAPALGVEEMHAVLEFIYRHAKKVRGVVEQARQATARRCADISHEHKHIATENGAQYRCGEICSVIIAAAIRTEFGLRDP